MADGSDDNVTPDGVIAYPGHTADMAEPPMDESSGKNGVDLMKRKYWAMSE